MRGVVVVGGVIANKYQNGGAVWTRLNWLLGFKQLGFQVCLMEQIARDQCTDADGKVCAFQECEQLKYFKRVLREFGLADAGVLIYDDGKKIFGKWRSELFELAASADVLVNITGHLTWEPLVKNFKKKIYIDLDPGYTQFWHAAGKLNLNGYDFYFTVGENIGKPNCEIPTNGIAWRPIRQPIVLSEWRAVPSLRCDRFTTVASWRGAYGRVEAQGKLYGQKAHEFRKFAELPRRAEQEFEIALDIHPAEMQDAAFLQHYGWHVGYAKRVVPDPKTFHHYVQHSSAEFSVAQGIYVDTNSGWFSDRTTRYLASGKPALIQDTGFESLPRGEGLLAFRTLSQAATGARVIARDYTRHCRAARALAEEYFAADKVLGNLMEQVDAAS